MPRPQPFALPPSSQWVHAEEWHQFPDLVHGFSTCVDDRERFFSQLQTHRWDWRTLKQVHGDEILFVAADHKNDVVEADGLTTKSTGVLLGIATADCVPVLLVAPRQRVIAALHAGWRGTLKGITVRALTLLSSTWGIASADVWLACGPAIGPCCYEVGREIGEALYVRWGGGEHATWKPHGETGMLDLRLLNLLQGEQCGVPRAHMQIVGPCTFCASSLFASYRRQGSQAKRQFSVIGWQESHKV